MSFLIDTCALSELTRKDPAPLVTEWFDGTPAESLHVSVLSFGEIRRGVERLPDSRRRSRISAWLENELPAWFENRVLPIDGSIADEWGRLTARLKNPLPAIDGLIAATALCRRLTVVTRNESDFAPAGVAILNPWRQR
ncbi:MAG: type II toxin-antitoxin system VapC family toxin [Gammaproteobacteria bacterium]|nr:type II toxin-antitoxin system VapC family toxin [Gammaproteobacteria bacterium]MDE0129001.1 type II toxin-antitoxin system VapC family toxin [Gammaproteobacteria bacterium]MDE0413628.1 type II toxin-antitoxin system VapC family toxin [Gammaproteobacteria bacterium]MXZ28907.1 type II toxin-antitoxin system VapC family toxin [Gammaproteobacteria bacterium]MYF58449.1 type II toxin-antitoxin system VapC family toxin [Gammaproteobacteria bacterium]